MIGVLDPGRVVGAGSAVHARENDFQCLPAGASPEYGVGQQ